MTSNEILGVVAALQMSLNKNDQPPDHVEGPLEALWHVGKGNYERATQLLEADFSKEAAWVRAHMHRRMEEHDKAAEWYDKAGEIPSTDPIDQEWTQVAAGILLNV